MDKLNRADELYKQKRYREAIPLYLEGLRETRSTMHYYKIGDCYEQIGDYSNAISYYEKGMQTEDYWAADALGRMYEKGRGVRKDYGKAVQCYEKASYLVLPSEIGDLYYYGGPGLNRDFRKAFEWYSKSNGATCIAMQGMCYINGQGVSKDVRKGIEILRSASYDSAIAAFFLGEMYYYGTEVKQDYYEAFIFYKKAVQHPYVDDDWRSWEAYAQLGRCYTLGKGCIEDQKKGFELFQKGTELGSARAMHFLGIAYVTGLGTPKNREKGYYWLDEAIKRGDKEAVKAKEGLLAYGK